MNTTPIRTRRLSTWAALLLLATLPMARAVTITEHIPSGEMEVAASSSWGPKILPQNLINEIGMVGRLWHDSDPNGETMWHTADHPQATSPGAGLPVAPAWIRINFKTPKSPDKCVIWNHNQDSLTTRGFREAMAFVTADGTSWKPILVNGKETFEIPCASGDSKEPSSLVLTLPSGPILGFVLLAKNNYGGNVYGLSALQFTSKRDAQLSSLPEPTAVSAVQFPFTTRSNGDWQRQVTVSTGTTSIYEAVDVSVESGGVTERTHFDADLAGRTSFTVNLPPGRDTKRSASDTVKVTLASGRWSRTVDAQLTASKWPNLEEIVVVFKSHFDIGFTHLASETVKNYQTTMIDNALKVVHQNRDLPADQQFVWTVPGWPMKKILEDWPGQTPQRQEQVRAAFKEGRFAAHALPFTMQTEMMEPEGMVRSLGFASQLARAAGKPLPTGAKMTDVPCHSWILPTLLSHAGVKFFHLGCNPASALVQVPMLFWWEGPDGSRVLTMFTADYGGGALPPGDWPHKTWLAMLMRGDNAGPPNPAEVKAVIGKIHQSMPGVKVRIGTLEDFGTQILTENPQLPVVRSDMPDTWIHGVMCDPESVRLERQTMPTIAAAEALHTLLGTWNMKTPEIAAALADAYENSVLFYEHTWGGDFNNFGIGGYLPPKDGIGQIANWKYGADWKAELAAGRYARLIKSWDEHSDYARTADKLITPVIRTQMEALAAAVAVKGPRTVLFNPLPWVREGVPALGYKTEGEMIPTDTASTDTAANMIENKYFKIVLDPALGSIASLVDKRTNRELVDAGTAHGFGQVLYERFSATEVAHYNQAYLRGKMSWGPGAHGKPNLPPASEVPYRAASSIHSKVEWNREGATASVEMRSDSVGFPVTTRVILNGNAPYLDLEVTVEKPADIWPEAGWVCLPFKVDAPQFRIGRNGSIINPATDIIPGANRYMYAVGTGVALFDSAGRGAGICGLDTPLVSLGEPGAWKFDREYVPKKPAVYFNLFNNHWSCNYRLWNEGKWTYRFRIWSFENYDATASLITPALEARYPLHAATFDGPAGTLPKEQPGISLSRPGVLLTAFGQNPDGDGTVLRVWEQAGVSGEFTCTLPAGAQYATATPVNLRGEKTGEPKKIEQGTLKFELHAYAPASFILK